MCNGVPVKVRLRCDIIEERCGDHPDLLLAQRGEIGELRESKSWDFSLKFEDGRVVGVRLDEIERLLR
jgi:hypothetical protein